MSIHESIPVRRESPDAVHEAFEGGLAWLGIILVVVLGIAVVWRLGRGPVIDNNSTKRRYAFDWKRVFPRKSLSDLMLVSSVRLTTKHSIHQVQWRGREILVGCSNDGIVLLCDSSVSDSKESDKKIESA